MHFHTFTFRKAFSRWPSLSGKTPVLLFPFNAFTYYHDYLQFMHKPPICQDLCLKNTPHHAYSLCNRPIYPADARCLFRGRFGISVLSGFPDNHPSWQENFSKLTLSSHVRPETLPEKSNQSLNRYQQNGSRDVWFLRSLANALRLNGARTAVHPCCTVLGTCM